MHAKIGFKFQVTGTPRFQWLYDCWYQMMWLFSGVPDNPDGDTVILKNGAEEFNSPMKCVMHTIWTEAEEDQHDVAHHIIHIATPWTTRRLSQMKLANREPTCSNTDWLCAPYSSGVDFGCACTSEQSCRDINFTACLKSGESSVMVIAMLLEWISRQQGLEWHFLTMAQWIATSCFGVFLNLQIAGWDMSAKGSQPTIRISWTWP